MTHTYASVEVSDLAYAEILLTLMNAGYSHAVDDNGRIDLHGLGLTQGPPPTFTEDGPPKVQITNLLRACFGAAVVKATDAEDKHSWNNGWLTVSEEDLQKSFGDHLLKNDPLDVIILCAIAWYHQHSLVDTAPKVVGVPDKD